MNEKTSLLVEEGVVVPESGLLKRLPKDYGHVPSLDDSELLGDIRKAEAMLGPCDW